LSPKDRLAIMGPSVPLDLKMWHLSSTNAMLIPSAQSCGIDMRLVHSAGTYLTSLRAPKLPIPAMIKDVEFPAELIAPLRCLKFVRRRRSFTK